MNWPGTIAGLLLGRLLFRNPLGPILLAILGNRFLRLPGFRRTPRGNAAEKNPRDRLDRRERGFLGALSAMLAKLAKADGRISEEEIARVEHIFARLGLSSERRSWCVEVFRRAKDDPHTIFDYAEHFAESQPDPRIRQLVYELLWDLAVADGTLASEEDRILRALPGPLRIWPDLYRYQRRRHVGEQRSGGSSSRAGRPQANEPSLTDCYDILGCRPDASDDEVRRAYRATAKEFHPDELQGRGLPPEFLERANVQMARLNDAYARVRKARASSSRR